LDIIPDPKVLLVQIGGFILILVVFKMFLFKPILGVLESRQREVEAHYKDAEDHREAAEKLRDDYEAHLARIEEDARAKIAEALKQGQEMRDEIIQDGRDRADKALARANDEIEREKDKALLELKKAAAGLAVGAAEKLIQEKLDDDKHRQLINGFIDELDEVSR